MSQFSYLYFFESDDLILVESKRVDIPSSASLSDVYKWTAYLKQKSEFLSLNFRSMNREENGEYRSFKEGELHFNDRRGELKLMNETFALKLHEAERIPESFRQELENYLSNLPHHH